jgi:hypothetical protein
VGIDRVILLNAGIYAHLYRPRIAQRLSLIPGIGARERLIDGGSR